VGDPGQTLEVPRDAVRLEGRGRACDDRRELGELLDQIELLRLIQHGEFHALGHGALRRPGSDPEDPAHPGVRHLHVEDRVLLRLTLR